MSSFDLLILPLARAGGQERPEAPGLYIARPPRRTARGRDRDHLVLYLTLLGSSPPSPEQANQLLEKSAKEYYRTPGTVTTAQRAVAESINQYLLDRNLSQASTGSQLVGLLTQVVLRNDRLSLAQSGPGHAFLITPTGVHYFHDPQMAGRGLGLTRTTTLRYSQADLQENVACVLSPDPPLAWTPGALMAAQGQGPESLRRRLLSHAGAELSAVLLQARAGTGELRLLRPARPPRPRLAPVEPETGQLPPVQIEVDIAPDEEEEPLVEPLPASIQDLTPEKAELTIDEESGWPPPLPGPSFVDSASTPPHSPRRVKATVAADQPVRELPSGRPKMNFAPLIVAWKAFTRALKGSARATGALLKRMLPDEGLFMLPPSTMAFIAIAVPLLVVTISGVVYLQRGRATQYQVYFNQAQEAAMSAQAETEPAALRQAWAATLDLIDKAEIYQKTTDSRDLRTQAQGALDSIDYVDRLDFQPALVDVLKETAHITRMVATDNDLYLLNAREGTVLRTTLTSTGYRLDPTFQCGPGPYAGVIVGAITDIAAFSKGNDLQATLLGLDSNGNLLYCIPGDAPLAVPMASPDIGWGKPQGLSYDTEDLYILDPQNNGVWIYRRMEVTQEPRLFFGDQIPPMQDVIDMAVNLNDLYLLHTDGHMTICVFSGLLESPTRCEEPAAYVDPRPGRESGPLIEAAYFTEILFVPPPDPSIYLLEPNSHSIYHLSVRLTFQRQYRSKNPLPEAPATAFAISRGNRTIFLATGNQVFYAPLP